MLVLTRRIGEKVIIYDDIVLQVVSIDRDKVRLAFAAPRDVPIHRQEVYERLHAQEESK